MAQEPAKALRQIVFMHDQNIFSFLLYNAAWKKPKGPTEQLSSPFIRNLSSTDVQHNVHSGPKSTKLIVWYIVILERPTDALNFYSIKTITRLPI